MALRGSFSWDWQSHAELPPSLEEEDRRRRGQGGGREGGGQEYEEERGQPVARARRISVVTAGPAT